MVKYPIFNSIVKRIEAELLRRGIKVRHFKTWDEATINATGLEIIVDLAGQNDAVRSVTINFDWDKFREASMALQMEGMSRHPLLQKKYGPVHTVTPSMDVEMSWQFSEDVPHILTRDLPGTDRIRAASEWMEHLNLVTPGILPTEHSLSRWHVDIEGDFNGRFVSQMQFITYYTFDLEDITSLNALHKQVDRKLQVLLLTTARMIQLCYRHLPKAS